jgi:hypothetical protein
MRRNASTTKVRASAASRFPIHFLSHHLSIPFFLSRHLSRQAAVSTGTPSLLRKVRASAASRTPITKSCTASQMHRITKRITKRSKDPGPTAGAAAPTTTATATRLECHFKNFALLCFALLMLMLVLCFAFAFAYALLV